MKILTVVGARPQFVKAAVVSRELKKQGIPEVIVHTGQHYDHGMSEVFFAEMDIPKPLYNLGIHGTTHGAMTGAMLSGIEEILLKEKPTVVLVYGDTNSTLAGALAAAKLNIPVAHVEAGLRSFNPSMPEEINRILTDRLSALLFVPTIAAMSNLKNEGFDSFAAKTILCGDVMQDAALFYAEKAEARAGELPFRYDGFALCTLHRAENTNDPERLKALVDGINRIQQKIPVILPLHPRTRAFIEQNRLNITADVVDPVGYLEMISLLQHCSFVMTDSGGLQKEAYFFRKPCITLREETEWVELLESGVNQLAGANADKMVKLMEELSENKGDFNGKLYGDGNAAGSIVLHLIQHFKH